MPNMMAENTVYFHFLREWKSWARAGELGQIYYAECEYVHAIRHLVVNRWRDERPPLYYCSHSLGPILGIMDDYIVRATGVGKTKTILPDGGVKGATIKLLRSSVAAKEPGGHFYTMYGSKGHVEHGRGRESSHGWLYLEDRPGYEMDQRKSYVTLLIQGRHRKRGRAVTGLLNTTCYEISSRHWTLAPVHLLIYVHSNIPYLGLLLTKQ